MRMDRTDTLDAVFLALADPHRRRILVWLRDGDLTVGALVARLPLSQPGVTKHLGVLERAGLVVREARGRERVCRLDPRGVSAAEAWLAEHRAFWTGALDRLAALAEAMETEHDDDDRDGEDREPERDRDQGDRGEP